MLLKFTSCLMNFIFLILAIIFYQLCFSFSRYIQGFYFISFSRFYFSYSFSSFWFIHFNFISYRISKNHFFFFSLCVSSFSGFSKSSLYFSVISSFGTKFNFSFNFYMLIANSSLFSKPFAYSIWLTYSLFKCVISFYTYTRLSSSYYFLVFSY